MYLSAANLSSTTGISFNGFTFVSNSSTPVGNFISRTIEANSNNVYSVPLNYSQVAFCRSVATKDYRYFPRRSKSSGELWLQVGLMMMMLLLWSWFVRSIRLYRYNILSNGCLWRSINLLRFSPFGCCLPGSYTCHRQVRQLPAHLSLDQNQLRWTFHHFLTDLLFGSDVDSPSRLHKKLLGLRNIGWQLGLVHQSSVASGLQLRLCCLSDALSQHYMHRRCQKLFQQPWPVLSIGN